MLRSFMFRSQILLTSAALALSCAAATGCDSASAGVQTPATARAPDCPARAPAMPAPRVQGQVRLVRPGPTVAVLCQFSPGTRTSKLKNSLIPRFVLRGPAAAGLAAVFDGAGPVTRFASHCDRTSSRLPFAQTVMFGYRSGPSRTVKISYPGGNPNCLTAVLTAGHRGAVLTSLDSDLFNLTGLNPHSHGDRTPNLIGLTVKAVLTRLKKAGFGFSAAFEGAAIDPRATVGTVIFAVPPAGVRVDRMDSQLGILLAVHQAPACTSSQLKPIYLGGEAGAGNDFGAILLRDGSGEPCRLTGPVSVTGLNAAGHPVTVTVSTKVIGPAVLSPRGQLARNRLPRPGTLAEQISVFAEYRDAPNGQLCAVHFPATWRVALPGGQVVKVANTDPANRTKANKSGGFYTCRRRLGVNGPVDYVVTSK
jgi:hypothetical protein